MTPDHYGPAEVLIGRFLKENPELRDKVQVSRSAPLEET
jgi:aryl-alcohol dehydrogenase-like predicted oxidoreductase